MVVDIAVLDGQHQRCGRSVGPGGVERMCVRLRDEADAGPAGVAQHGTTNRRADEQAGQHRVTGESPSHCSGVVPQLPDLRCSLHHEREAAAGEGPDRSAAEKGILVTAHHVNVIEAVVPDGYDEARRIPTTNLQPVDGGESLVDREQHGTAGLAGWPAQ